MKDYKNWAEQDLRALMVSYKERLKELNKKISEYLAGAGNKNQISEEYKCIKNELKEIFRYCDKVSNWTGQSDFYRVYFKPAFRDAYIRLSPATNARINQALSSAVYEAEDDIGFYLLSIDKK